MRFMSKIWVNIVSSARRYCLLFVVVLLLLAASVFYFLQYLLFILFTISLDLTLYIYMFISAVSEETGES
jgi:hypothetical protein